MAAPTPVGPRDRSAREVRALGPDTWPAFEALAAKHNGVWGGCWCTWFHPAAPEQKESAEDRRDLKHRLVLADAAHAALVMDGDRAIGWAQYGAVAELPGIHHHRTYEADRAAAGEPLPDWRVTCFFVDRDHRRSGVARQALQGALDLIAAAGGGVVEGYPHDTGGLRKSASFLYATTREVFEDAGFAFVRTKGQGNTVMRRTVRPSTGG